MHTDLTPDQHAMLGHLTELRRGVVSGDSASKQLECAVLLLDLYEAILEVHGILIYEDQKEVTKQ